MRFLIFLRSANEFLNEYLHKESYSWKSISIPVEPKQSLIGNCQADVVLAPAVFIILDPDRGMVLTEGQGGGKYHHYLREWFIPQ
jgi:hypothetical protein